MATVKALVLAWGWGWGSFGWWWWAGWLIYNAAFSIVAQAYSITVGTGWAWDTDIGWTGTNWNDSIFSTLIAKWWWGWGSRASDFVWINWANGWCWWWGSPVDTVWRTSWGTNGGFGQWYAGWQAGWAYPAQWGWWWGWTWAVWASTTTPFQNGANGWSGTANSISWSSVNYWWGWGWCSYVNTPWTGIDWWGNGWCTTPFIAATDWINWLWWWGWWGWFVFTGWRWWDWVVIISYKTDWSDWISNTSTGGTITTSWLYTIHTFTTSGTFTAVASATSNASFLYNMI